MAWKKIATTSSPGNISLTILGGYNNVVRNGNTVSGQLGIGFEYPGTRWTANSVVGSYNGVKYYAQYRVGGSGSYNTDPNNNLYCASWVSSGYNTSETYPWNFSAQVVGNAPGEITVTIGVGWSDWAGTIKENYTFTIPYPSAPSNVNLFVNKEKIDGSYEGAKLWKTISVPYGGSYSETWNETGFNSVTFANSNVVEALNHTRKATRLQYYLDLCGFLDNTNKDTLKNGVVTYGTCSLSFNDGTAQQNELTDYNKKHRYGTTYNFLNIKPSIGHTYKGVKEGSLTGQITKDTITRLNFVTNDVYANCNKDSPGDVYIKVNNEWKRASAVYYNKNGDWIKING